ncbi:hypothetical protein P692DRAFT_20883974 [Suillus brevipes Sb2]|nr:hypothetical protein P692DRAFT_20883974 [Suillus brevipes Sb2]
MLSSHSQVYTTLHIIVWTLLSTTLNDSTPISKEFLLIIIVKTTSKAPDNDELNPDFAGAYFFLPLALSKLA